MPRRAYALSALAVAPSRGTCSSILMRICGECRLCCNVFPLPALGKPAGRWCRHVGPAGCMVHESGLPEVCSRYACYWLEHEVLPDESRPDRIGMVATESGTITVGGHVLPVLVINLVDPDSDRGPAAQAMLEDFLAAGKAALLLHGPDMRIVYDRTRYPTITPDDIEAAYRYELSQDAEELRRLGAVGDGFQPIPPPAGGIGRP
ncbi:MAG: hypothetical protein ACHQ49_00270 [Elusimicrobiota bacterium]